MKENILTDKFQGSIIRAGFYPLLFLLSLTWKAYYNTGMDTSGMASFIAQQAVIFSFLQLADTMVQGRKIKYVFAGISTLYLFLIHFNALLLSITSMNLFESVTVLALGGDFLYTLEEAGFFTGFLVLLVLILALIASAGGAAYRYMPHVSIAKKYAGMILLIFILSSAFFVSEQIINRNSDNFFSRRIYPLYLEIFSSNNDTVTFTIPGNRIPGPDTYKQISKAENPKNVIVIVLESFRSDSINKELSPFMAELASESPVFTNYFTDAIYTSLAWNTILMDRPVYTLADDIDYDREHAYGSGIFRIFKNAGYDTYISFSANMEWKNFHERVSGRDSLIDNYYCGYQRRDEERNFVDTRATARAAEWIKQNGNKKPFFMMMQLDSTHWTYYADKEFEISKPFAGKDVNIAKLRAPEDIGLLLNRYKNSVRKIDSEIRKITAALKENGIYGNTALIIVSDHGEGFSPGMVGHSVMHNDIKKPAFIMHLPGIKKFSSDTYMSHMDIFPTLFNYLKIKGADKVMRGKSILDKNNNRNCALSFHGSSLMADINFDGYTVFFRVKKSGNSITFTPVKYTDRNGNSISRRDSKEWKDALKKIIGE